MNWILVATLLVFAGTLIGAALRRLRQFRLKERYALIFVFSSIPFCVLAVNPSLIEFAAQSLGVDYRTFQLIGVTAFLVFVVIELLTIVSVQERRITRLAQRVALLEPYQRAEAVTPSMAGDQGDRWPPQHANGHDQAPGPKGEQRRARLAAHVDGRATGSNFPVTTTGHEGEAKPIVIDSDTRDEEKSVGASR